MDKVKKALIVTRVSGFVPQFEMNRVHILQQMGYEVHYAANFDVIVYGEDNSRLDATGIVCHHIAFCRSPFSPKVMQAYRQLKALMQKEQFDLIHCHMPMTGVVTRIAAKALCRTNSCPVLYTTHGFHFFSGAPLKNWLYYLPERWLARYTDRLITINEEDFQRAKKFHIRGKVEKISGVGVETHIISTGGRHEMRKKLGVSEEEFLFVSVGELNANKNHIQVLRALIQCANRKIRYIICGTGSLREELERYIQEQGLTKQVTLYGYCSEIDKMLSAADCFVFPSLREGLSVALMEAMRAGLPIIAKQIRGNVDLIKHEKGGFLLQNGTVAEYVDAMNKIMSMDTAPMSIWNKEKVENFSIDRVDAEMRAIYQDVCGEAENR